ncbi:MAG: hypothetical protein Q8J85_04715 [Sulfuricurvum sp.]|jgi:hypothetical protein|nr:hypothetical protein [Sulfuricurvum sp.]MDP3022707.1 hypothetical protein [Sulfuricurvum sp.]
MKKELENFIDEIERAIDATQYDENEWREAVLMALVNLFAEMEPNDVLYSVHSELFDRVGGVA